MIDTICLSISKSEFVIIDYDAFTPNCQYLLEAEYVDLGKGGSMKCVQNPSKKEIKRGIYKPKLTLVRYIVKNRKSVNDATQEIALYIECSIPKLVMGNNFSELSNYDFQSSSIILMNKLEEMGVIVDCLEVITKSSVRKIHYSKNIVFNDSTPIRFILNAIHKADVSKRLDDSKTDYRNGGSIIRYHCNSYELCFYDKLKDLIAGKKSDKRALEGENGMQTHWIDKLKAEGLSILRMEVRLNSKDVIKQFLGKSGISVFGVNSSKLKLDISTKNVDESLIQLTFADLFDSKISRAICLYFWDFVQQRIASIVFDSNKVEELYYKILETGVKSAKALELASIINITNGMRDIRSVAGATIAKKVKALSPLISTTENYTYVTFCKIKKALDLFESVRIEDYIC